MPTDVVPVPAWYAPGLDTGQAPSGMTPEGSVVQAGGMEWEGEPPSCKGTTKKGWPCTAAPIEGEDLCIGHKRAKG